MRKTAIHIGVGGAFVRAGAVALTLAGCENGGQEASDEAEATDGTSSATAGDEETGSEAEPSHEPGVHEIPLDGPVIHLDARCFALESSPTEWSVAPEGSLWIRLDATHWRVIDPLGGDAVQELSVDAEVLQAQGPERALAIADGELLDVRGGWPQALAWPEDLPAPTQLCGDPSTDANGFVLADGLLHRDRGQWWQWTSPADEPWADAAWLASNAGTCLGPDGELWLGLRSGAAWRITTLFAERVEAIDDADAAVRVDGLGIAARIDDELVIGEPDQLRRYRFEAGPVRELSAGAGALWLLAGEQLYRMLDGELATVVRLDLPSDELRLAAEGSGGAWAITPQRACHLRSARPLQLDGLHHLRRLSDETFRVSVRPEPARTIEAARLDGEPLSLAPTDDGRWQSEMLAVEPGWHTLELDAEGHTRTLRFEQRHLGDLTWTTDIEPLFQEHCSGEACHGPGLADGTRPDLSTWEAWVEREPSILARVIEQGTMPPLSARKESWGVQSMLAISEWFESGAAKGDE